MKRSSWFSLGLLVIGCGGSNPPHAAPAPLSPPPRDPAPVQAAPPAASANPAEPSAPAPRAPSPFHVIVDHPGAMQLHAVGALGFLTVDEKIVAIRDKHVGLDRAHMRGLSSEGTADRAITGDWPDNAWLLTSTGEGAALRTVMSFWDGMRWKTKHRLDAGQRLVALAPWSVRRTLALLRDDTSGTSSFRVVAGFPLTPVPQPTAGTTCPSRVKADAAAILRSGHVVMAGALCPETNEAPAALGVERWEPGSKQGKIDELPESRGLHVSGIAAHAPTDVLVVGTTPQPAVARFYAASFDGSSWRVEQAKVPDAVVRLSLAEDGTVWGACRDGAVAKRDGRHAWSLVGLPEVDGSRAPGLHAVDVWARSESDAWVLATYEDSTSRRHTVLLHTSPPDGAVDLGSSR